jgi:1A family penicillin-binding protein
MVKLKSILIVFPFILILIGDLIRYLITIFLIQTASLFDKLTGHVATYFPKFIKYRRITFRLPAVSLQIFSGVIKNISFRYNRKPVEHVIYPSPLQLARQLKAFFFGVTFTLLFIFLPYSLYTFVSSLPNPTLLKERNVDVSSKIFDRNGILLYEIYAEQNRTPVLLEDLPKHLIDATIAIEDRDYYRHNGFSIRGIIRAVRETIVHKNIQGGSTITQQLIKSALLTPEVNVIRKIKEILLAFWAERIYSKNQILEMYLNQVPYGGTAWGIEAASRTYFGIPAEQLTIAQATLLAGLPQAPSDYSPYGANPQKATLRQRQVLDAMVSAGYLRAKEADEILNTPLNISSQHIDIKAPHFVMYIKDLIEKIYGTRLVERGGLRIKTTIDLKKQHMAEMIVGRNIETLEKLNVQNGAALITAPASGQILTMVGSKDYFNESQEGNFNVTTSLRQPGSAIKVITYSLALENGYTATTWLEDAPVSYRSPGSPVYTPVNYDGRFHGKVTLRSALANSYNIPAVRLLYKLGIKSLLVKAKLMGIDTWNDEARYGLSLTLGGADVTMLDMAEAYGTLANLGLRVDLSAIISIQDYTGRLIFNSPDNPKTVRALKPAAAYIITDILSDNVARTPAFGSNSQLYFPQQIVAVKTGTSNEKRDNWTVGYTPDFVVTVWVGNNDNSPMDPVLTSGITGAAPIFREIMSELLKNSPAKPFAVPSDIVSRDCGNNRREFFISGSQPSSGCRNIESISPALPPSPEN